jgi:hypothetical protein
MPKGSPVLTGRTRDRTFPSGAGTKLLMKRKAWFLGGLVLGGAQLVSMVTVSCSGTEPIDGSGGSTGGTTDGSGGRVEPTGGNKGSGGAPDTCPDDDDCEGTGGIGGFGGFGGIGGFGGLGGFGGDAP